jgi:hypothetical protein
VEGAARIASVEGEYWLRLQMRIGHWARVRVQVTPDPHREVRVADDACAWLADVYGTSAPAAVPPDLKAAAESGAGTALADAGTDGTVIVTGIQHVPADTSADDVRFATAWAVWQAIGHQPNPAPYIDGDGVHFPPAAE